MIVFLGVLALVIPFTVAGQDPKQVAELRTLARTGPDSALVDRVRHRPDDAREALRQLLAGAAEGATRSADLAAGGRIAGAYAVAWRDSFLFRGVARFRLLSPADRRTTVAAESLAIAGMATLRRSGPDSAILMWRQSLQRLERVSDTAGVPAALARIGWGFYYAQEYDSADAYLKGSLDRAQRIGDHLTVARALKSLGAVSERRGDLPRASALYTRAKQISEQYGAALDLAKIQNNIGNVAGALGDRVGRDRAYQAALVASKSTGDADLTAMILSNVALAAIQEGDYGKAATSLHRSLSIYKQRGNLLDALVVLYNLGALELRRGDYVSAIAALSEAAGLLRRTGPGGSVNEIDVRVELAHARAETGDLQGAGTELERAESLGSRLTGGGASLGSLALARGNLAVIVNRFPEAEQQYARVERIATGGTPEEVEARERAQIAMAQAFFKRKKYAAGQAALERVLRRGTLDVHNAASVRMTLGQAALRTGDTAVARRAFVAALDTMRALGAVADEAEAFGLLGDLEAQTGRALTADSLYRRGLARLAARPAPGVAWELHASLAANLRRRGALEGATQELLAGIGEIERVSGSLQLEEQRSAFQTDKWNVYVDLALVQFARGRAEAAFEASERLRARQMIDLLARGHIGRQGRLGELAIREQDLRRKIGERTMQAGEGEPAEETPGLRDPASRKEASARASQELAQLQEDYGKLLLQIRSADPSYASLVRGETAAARSVMAALGPEEALLEYLVGDSTTLVFVVTRDTVAGLDLKLSHDAVTAEVDFARSKLASRKEGGAHRAWRAPLERLYSQLIGPVEASGLLAGKRRLLIAPHAELHYLPFAALVGAGPPEQLLVERYLIDYVPSASVWLRLRDRSRPAPSHGILALAPRAAALPGSRSEVAAIKRIYGDRAQTMVGSPATEAAFRSLASNREIIHLATYGVLNKHNPLFSYVELGKAPGEDGRLEVHEVFGLSLNARLLVLSACQTGLAAGALSDVPPGDDWVGLVQGFLYAGAGNVVATLWPVADVATARLMERFYEELATGGSETEALAQAQRAALRDPLTAHPFYWAGFTLVRGR